MSATRAAHAAPMPRAAPVTIPTVIRRSLPTDGLPATGR